ncbi:hypothetical protein ACLOJK_027770 [Asimina triloba]
MTGRKIPSGQQEADDHDHDESQAAAAAAEEARQARPHGFVDFLWGLLFCGQWAYEPVPVPEPRARTAEPQDQAGPATTAQFQEREGRCPSFNDWIESAMKAPEHQRTTRAVGGIVAASCSSSQYAQGSGSSSSGVRVEEIIDPALSKNATASSAGSAAKSISSSSSGGVLVEKIIDLAPPKNAAASSSTSSSAELPAKSISSSSHDSAKKDSAAKVTSGHASSSASGEEIRGDEDDKGSSATKTKVMTTDPDEKQARDSGAVAEDITGTDRPSELRGDDDDEMGGLA